MAQVTVEIYDYEFFKEIIEKYGLTEIDNKPAPWGGNEITVEGDTPTGTTADAEGFGDAYFEIADYEFKYFEPVYEIGSAIQPGPTRLDLIVTPENAEEMIDLIKKVFKK